MKTQENLEEIGIGEEKPMAEPKTCRVTKTEVIDIPMKEGTSKKLNLYVQHPDIDEPLEISGVYYLQGTNIKQSGLWVNIDIDGKIMGRSALASFLRYVKAETIGDLVGKTVETVTNDRGFLSVKAY